MGNTNYQFLQVVASKLVGLDLSDLGGNRHNGLRCMGVDHQDGLLGGGIGRNCLLRSVDHYSPSRLPGLGNCDRIRLPLVRFNNCGSLGPLVGLGHSRPYYHSEITDRGGKPCWESVDLARTPNLGWAAYT